MSAFKCCIGFAFALLIVTFLDLSAQADSFSEGFHENCVRSAIASVESNGVKADAKFQKMTNEYCDCAQKRVQGEFTASELLTLAAATPDPAVVARIKPIMQQCYKETFQ